MSNIPSVNVWCPAAYQPYLETVLTRLQGARDLRVHAYEEGDISTIEAALAETSDQPVVIFHESLADVLSRAMAHLDGEQDTPSATGENRPRIVAALDDWVAGNAALSALFYRYRSQMTLLPALALLHKPAAVQDLLIERFCETPPPRPDTPVAFAELLPARMEPKFALMASAILQTAPEAQAARDQMDALSTPLDAGGTDFLESAALLDGLLAAGQGSEEETQEDTEAVQQAMAERAERQALDLRHLQTAHERDMQILRHKADALQIRLLDTVSEQAQLSDLAEQKQAEADALRETYDAQLARLKEDKASLTTQLEDLSDMVQQKQAEADALRETYEQQTTRLEQERTRFEDLTRRQEESQARLQEQIASQRGDITALAQDLQHRDAEAEDLRRQVHDLLNTTSWKITRPMRVVVRGVRRVLGR